VTHGSSGAIGDGDRMVEQVGVASTELVGVDAGEDGGDAGPRVA
jgi:hypothetical protein